MYVCINDNEINNFHSETLSQSKIVKPESNDGNKQPNVPSNPTAHGDEPTEHVNQSKYKVKVDKNGGIYANIRGLYPKSNQTKVPYLADLANLNFSSLFNIIGMNMFRLNNYFYSRSLLYY